MSIDSDIKRGIRLVEKQIALTIKGTALSLFGAIIKDTPVDTGRLRGNWDVTLNKESNYKSDTVFDKTGGATISKTKAALGKYKTNDDIYMTNNLEYAVHIEKGTEKIRGHHMVERVKEAFNRELEKNASKFRIK